MAKSEKRPMKQGRRKRGLTKGMKKAIADRVENPKLPKKFPKKAAALRQLPGTPAPVKRGRRFRLRATVFQRVLLAWPLAVFVVMLFVSST